MKRFYALFIALLISVPLTIILYQPVSLAIYKLKEPYFKCPIKNGVGGMALRNDSRGSGEFGAKRVNGHFHTGIDILAPVNTPVYASRSGLAFCLNVPTGYGKYVMIYHPDGVQSIYAHLSAWNIPPVKNVKQGDAIGFVGKTGNAANRSMEPHLHFEIRVNGVPRNPHGLMR